MTDDEEEADNPIVAALDAAMKEHPDSIEDFHQFLATIGDIEGDEGTQESDEVDPSYITPLLQHEEDF